MRIGLVLGGGGAKGAYQVGVYKALCEVGLDASVLHCIAGTSVGSLNALLFEAKTSEVAVGTVVEEALLLGGVVIAISRSLYLPWAPSRR